MRSGRKLKQMHAVAGADARLRAHERRLDELVGLAALVGRRDRLLAAVGVVGRVPATSMS